MTTRVGVEAAETAERRRRARAAARRRADAFATLLDDDRRTPDGTPSGTSASHPGTELSSLLAVVERLRAVPAPAPRAEFRDALRSRLVAAAAAQAAAVPPAAAVPAPGVPARPAARTSRRLPRWAAAVLGAAAASTALSGVAVAGVTSLPGDPLYPVRTGVEDVRLELADGDVERGRLLLDHATRRLQEVDALAVRRDADPAVLADTLERMQEATRNGAEAVLVGSGGGRDARLVRSLATWSTLQAERLADVVPALPAPVQGDAVEALDFVQALVSRTDLLLGPCLGCADGPAGPAPGGGPAGTGGATSASPAPASPVTPGTSTDDPTGGAGGAPVPTPVPAPPATGGDGAPAPAPAPPALPGLPVPAPVPGVGVSGGLGDVLRGLPLPGSEGRVDATP